MRTAYKCVRAGTGKTVFAYRLFVGYRIVLGLVTAMFALQSQTETSFRSDSRLVQLSVSVTRTDTGQPVEGLSAQDFVIRDDGRGRVVERFSQGESQPPLKVMVLVETSSAQVGAVTGLLEALPIAVGKLRPADLVGLGNVLPGHEILLQPTVDCSKLSPALARLKANQDAYWKGKRDGAKFDFNDLTRALVDISRKETDAAGAYQLVNVLVTDDFDLLNPAESADAAKLLEKNRTLVAAFVDVQNTGIAIAKKNVHVMRMVTPMRLAVRDRGASYFAAQTGGPVVQVQGGDYRAAMETLLRDLSKAYTIGFTPAEKELDGRFHKLSVSINRSELKGKVKLVYREGYWAER